MKPFLVKPYSPKELSSFYGVCDKTFKRWLRPHLHEIGKKEGHYYTVLQVKIIIEKIGLPGFVYEE